MKYIDAEKLIAEIEHIHSEAICEYNSHKSRYSEGAIDVVHRISSIITSLQQEQPSLLSNLDEAAQRIAYDVCKQLPNGEEKDGIVYYAILAAKAGAEWMAGQISKAE